MLDSENWVGSGPVQLVQWRTYAQVWWGMIGAGCKEHSEATINKVVKQVSINE